MQGTLLPVLDAAAADAPKHAEPGERAHMVQAPILCRICAGCQRKLKVAQG